MKNIIFLRFLIIVGLILIAGAIYGFINPETCEILTGCGYTTLCEGASFDPNDYETACSGVKSGISIGLLASGFIAVTVAILLSSKSKN